MNKRFSGMTVLICALALPGWSPMSFAEQAAGKEAGQKVDEAARAIGNYSAEQRDEALRNAKSVLEDADTRIERLDNEMRENWDRMSAAAREQALDTMKTLRRQRLELAERYGELKRSSVNAWEEVKRGFAKSFDELRSSFAKAAREF